jgi:hypothetical protein
VAGRRLDRSPTASSRRMNSRTSFLISVRSPDEGQLASFGFDRRIFETASTPLEAGGPSIRSLTAARRLFLHSTATAAGALTSGHFV